VEPASTPLLLTEAATVPKAIREMNVRSGRGQLKGSRHRAICDEIVF
jgi:hypothetical protein